MHHLQHRILRTTVAFASLLALSGATESAQAAARLPFTITETVDPSLPYPGGTFTATGPLCPSGTWADNVEAVGPNPKSEGIDHKGGVNLLVRTVFTCNDGSGAFNALKHVFFTFTDDGNAIDNGHLQLLGGTDAYTKLIGHATDNGDTASNQGLITGFVTER